MSLYQGGVYDWVTKKEQVYFGTPALRTIQIGNVGNYSPAPSNPS
jgi:hypothetical protein